MTVEDLLYFLESGIENGEFDLETEIRIATQPRYPLESRLEDEPVNVNGTIYLATEEQVGYLEQEVKDKLNW